LRDKTKMYEAQRRKKNESKSKRKSTL